MICESVKARKLTLFKKLSEENFSEEFVKEIKLDAQSEYPEGIHTISEFGNFFLYRSIVRHRRWI